MFRLRSALRQGISAAQAAPEKTSSTGPVKTSKLFDKILIANRGEIVLRVCRTAKRLGIKTVAVYSEPDAHSMHVREADEAICVGPAASTKSYLNIPRILAAIESSGAQAVHPGYGFLSENSGFVKQLEERGVTFIGPGAAAMSALGEKIHSKKLAMDAGVRTVPGYVGDVPTPEEAVRIARDIGYPVMIKASSGGGGKGMRIAYNDDETRLGYRLSKAEAKSAFASDSLFVEKYIEKPRHIEVQLIADSFGNVVAFPERECTVQRRNQKVIEESPSPFLDPVTRKAMQDQASLLARSVGYVSAGTCEFLVDKHKNFFFLEMNTRLQVEHPVSEMVSGHIDLVELMIRIAAGEKLPASLTGGTGAIPFNGHAFESRVYAEDPFRGFLPSTGRLSQYVEPQAYAHADPYVALLQPDEAGVPQIRLRADAGVTQGSEISMFYDPMICKLITHGPTRADALDRMRASLDAYVIRGVGHNVAFLRDLIDHPKFCSGDITTAFIKEEYPIGFRGVKLTPVQRHRLVAAAAIMNLARREAESLDAPSAPPSMLDVVVTLANGGVTDVNLSAGAEPSLEEVAAVAAGRGIAYAVKLHLEGPSPTELPSGYVDNETPTQAGSTGKGASSAFPPDTQHHHHMGSSDVWVADITPHARNRGAFNGLGAATGPTVRVRLGNVLWSPNSPLLLAEVLGLPEGTDRSLHMLRVQQINRLHAGFRLQVYGHMEDVTVLPPRAFGLSLHMLAKAPPDMSRLIVSPMPGALKSVAVAVGEAVEEGQEVAIIEAMKMQNVLRAPKKGKVKAILAKPGDTLAVDQSIIEFE